MKGWASVQHRLRTGECSPCSHTPVRQGRLVWCPERAQRRPAAARLWPRWQGWGEPVGPCPPLCWLALFCVIWTLSSNDWGERFPEGRLCLFPARPGSCRARREASAAALPAGCLAGVSSLAPSFVRPCTVDCVSGEEGRCRKFIGNHVTQGLC